MRKLTYLVASTIDGFIAGPGGDDPSGPDGFFLTEGDHMEALFRDYPETIPGHLHQVLGIAGEPHSSSSWLTATSTGAA